MKIRMKASFAGTGFSVNSGEVTDRFGAGEAKRMIDAGYAVPVIETKAATAKKQAKARAATVETR